MRVCTVGYHWQLWWRLDAAKDCLAFQRNSDTIALTNGTCLTTYLLLLVFCLLFVLQFTIFTI